MTTSRDVDEIASALIDGALGPDEAEAARRDPAVAARAAEMHAARVAVRRVPAPDPARRDDAIAAALTAYDPASGMPGYDVAGDPAASGGLDAPVGGPAGGPAGPASPPPPPTSGPAGPVGVPPAGPGDRRVVPMGPARRRRWADPRWLGAAAAVLLVLALGGVLATAGTSSDDSSGDETATAMEDSAPSTTGDQSAGESGGGSAEGGGDTGSASPEQSDPGAAPDRSSGAPSSLGVVDLGDVDTADELAERAGQALTATRTESDAEANAGDETPPADGDGSSGSGPLTASEVCPDPLASTEDAGPAVLQGRATLGGEPVDVWVHDNGTTRRMVAVATDGSCAVVANRPIPG